MRTRIRTVKPEFFKHYELYLLDKRTGNPCRLAFEGLWCVADREGRFQWRPRYIKLEVMPWDEVDFDLILKELVADGFLVQYEVAGEVYGWIPSFDKHQVINNKEAASEIPGPDHPGAKILSDLDAFKRAWNAWLTREGRVDEVENPTQGEGNGTEGNGKGKGTGSGVRVDDAGAPPATDFKNGGKGGKPEKPTVILQLTENESMEFHYCVEQWPITNQKDLLCKYTATSVKDTIRRGIMALRQKHKVDHVSKVPSLGAELLWWVLGEKRTLVELSRGDQIKATKHWDEQVTMGLV